jgi:hypothetical protein
MPTLYKNKFIVQLSENMTKQHMPPHKISRVDEWLQKNYLDSSVTAFAYVPQLFACDNSVSDNTKVALDKLTRSFDSRVAKAEDYIV